MIESEKLQSQPGRTPRVRPTFYRPEGPLPLSVTIRAAYPRVESLIRNVENFPQFLDGLKKVEVNSASQATWYFQRTDDEEQMSFTMNLELAGTQPEVRWRSSDAMGFDYLVRLWLENAPGDRGTIVRMQISYDSQVGEWAQNFERLFGKDPRINSRKNLLRLKAFCETGSVPTTEGQPSGREEITLKH